MIRKMFFWLHLSTGIAAGVFIFIMAATGVVLSFERRIVEFVDRDLRFVYVPNDVQPMPLNQLLHLVQRAGIGDSTAIVLRNQPQAATQFAIQLVSGRRAPYGRDSQADTEPRGSASGLFMLQKSLGQLTSSYMKSCKYAGLEQLVVRN
ncbi:MAG: PepSY domain-containing protein [Acidobacteriota bacterium]|nr:PepSY domain-containing protein [Acidobacteriota bacterium]